LDVNEAATMSDSVFSVGSTQAPTASADVPPNDSIDISKMLAGQEVSAPPKLYRIGEVIQHSGLSRQTIHNYTAMGLIRESKWTPTGHRLYGEDVFRYISLIKQLRTRYSLAQIKQMLHPLADS
jgi:hypothetical protein